MKELIHCLKANHCRSIQAHDPYIRPADIKTSYDVEFCEWENLRELDALIIAVPHSLYRAIPIESFIQTLNSKGCLIDLESILNPDEVNKFCIRFWQEREIKN